MRHSPPHGHALTAPMVSVVDQDRDTAAVATQRVLDAAPPASSRVTFPREPALRPPKVKLVGRGVLQPAVVDKKAAPAQEAAAGAPPAMSNFKALKEAHVRTEGETRKAYRARLMEKLKAKKAKLGVG